MKPVQKLSENTDEPSFQLRPEMNREFISALSHELRTPMNGVMGMTELLAATEMPPQQRNFLEEVQHSAEALWKVIDDFLDFASLEQGDLRLRDENIDPGQMSEDVIECLAEAAHRKLLEIMCYVEPDCPLVIQGDQRRIGQILESLVGTAIRLTRKGCIIVRVNPNHETNKPTSIRFTVESNGVLVGEPLFERFFEPFSIEDDASIDKYHVTGLGLAVSQKLATLMGGELSVEQGPGIGLNLTFDLPIQTASVVNTSRVDRTFLSGIIVLVVAENPNQREVLTRQLRDYGAQADSADGGDEALEQLEKARDAGQPYAMVVVERDMMQMDGMTFAHLLCEVPVIEDTPVVLLDALNQQSDPEEYEGTGIVGYLTKPVTAKKLVQLIAEVTVKPRGGDQQRTTCMTAPSTNDSLTAKVLVAEDNRVNREIVVSMLKNLGCQCDTVENGQLALKALQSRHYDLVLMDCQMPLMDGFEATRAIRLQEDLRKDQFHIPIVALTANNMDGDRERCLAVGMDDFIAKPFKKEHLVRALAHYLPDLVE